MPASEPRRGVHTVSTAGLPGIPSRPPTRTCGAAACSCDTRRPAQPGHEANRRATRRRTVPAADGRIAPAGNTRCCREERLAAARSLAEFPGQTFRVCQGNPENAVNESLRPLLVLAEFRQRLEKRVRERVDIR